MTLTEEEIVQEKHAKRAKILLIPLIAAFLFGGWLFAVPGDFNICGAVVLVIIVLTIYLLYYSAKAENEYREEMLKAAKKISEDDNTKEK